MDLEETASSVTKNQKRGFYTFALRLCTVIVFSVVGFFLLSFLLGILVVLLGELWVSSSSSYASLASRCKIVSSCLQKCVVERDKFKCRYDYNWASVFKVNETYDCWHTLSIPKIKLYRDGFFGCQADDLSFTDIFKQYDVFVNGRRKYWRYDVIAGIVSGFSTSIITVFIIRILRHAKSWFPRACCSVKNQISKVNLLVQVKRACLVVVYFSILGWMATQYLKILFLKA
ncbi:unnamed protein product [Eruca vesicaria subsp. sativa]|uniref:Uncharacterized protein n=1 Tax=Eruca vesicaria subsp. sativa TaxID=29727 RepID=A0ABC8KMW5_ERUVS|nr:unnamed protein product [Eruca vesicaria subsp. sativa]